MTRLDKLRKREETLAKRVERAREKAAIYQNLVEEWQKEAGRIEAEYDEAYEALCKAALKEETR